MKIQIKPRKRWLALGVMSLMVVFMSAMTIGGCATEEEDPVAESSSSALITAATLQGWIDADYKDGDGNSIVILYDGEDAGLGHVDGAHANPVGKEDRSNGIAKVKGLVLSGAAMDTAIRGLGIDDTKTIVFTFGAGSTGKAAGAMRAWWTFRYWGFDRTKLKVLDGYSEKVMGASYLTLTATAAPTASTYSVAANKVDTSIVATLDDVVAFAELTDQTGYAVFDVRSAEEYAGTTLAGNAFQGHVKGATHINYSDWLDADGKFISKTAMLASLAAPTSGKAILSTDTIYAHCQTATRSGTTMFALMEILEFTSVKNWDGSWSEWGNMVATDHAAVVTAAINNYPDNVYLTTAEEALWNTYGLTVDAANNTGLADSISRIFIAEASPTTTADKFIVEDTAYTTDTTD